VSNHAHGCCCAPGTGCYRDCVFGAEIASGCCHKTDPLILWCERPTFTYRENYQFRVGSPPLGAPTHERCCSTTTNGQDPVQAIYHYHDCYYRCIAVTALEPITNLVTLGTKCRDLTCYPGDAGPCAPTDDCCDDDSNTNPACCNCGVPWLSNWRREKLKGYQENNDYCIPDTPTNVGYEAGKWLLETTCHKGGAPLGFSGECCAIGGYSQCSRLLTQVIAIVHFERWWRIAECASGAQIYVPGGTGEYNTSDLVPKWWIHACGGIPLYGGDLCDAVRFGIISSREAEQLVAQILDPVVNGMPSQPVLRKLANAGYLGAKDWRAEQRQAYIDLDARFPSAGYGAFVEPVDDMHALGPFRKRMTYATVGVSTLPLLRKADVTADTNLSPLQADGFLAYPGSNLSQADYDYWAERQWVYFRARPGGWVWAGWEQGSGQTEIDDILLGNGRGDGDCIAAFYGNPRTSITRTTCSACDNSLTVCGCDDCPEHSNPTLRCATAQFGTPDGTYTTPCTGLVFSPVCEGLAIQSHQYEIENTMVLSGGSCQRQDTWKCLQTTRSYLIEAKRSTDSWLDSIPYQCRDESPALPPFRSFPDLVDAHNAHATLCNFISGATVPANNPSGKVYTNADLCCGGKCYDFTTYCGWDPCDSGRVCTNDAGCPPFDLEAQRDCIGFDPGCDE
jgi:hypothetical protein